MACAGGMDVDFEPLGADFDLEDLSFSYSAGASARLRRQPRGRDWEEDSSIVPPVDSSIVAAERWSTVFLLALGATTQLST